MIGNCAFSALVDGRGRIVWCCLPRFDADPVFNALLDSSENGGHFSIEVEDLVKSTQWYEPNTAILRTRLTTSMVTAWRSPISARGSSGWTLFPPADAGAADPAGSWRATGAGHSGAALQLGPDQTANDTRQQPCALSART
jgi:hypothetical protein